MTSEYNLRQIALMKEAIIKYKEGQIRIDQLIYNLESLFNCLEEMDKAWKSAFLSFWDILEIVYASALYNNKTILDDNDMIEINKGLRGLDALIDNLCNETKKNQLE